MVKKQSYQTLIYLGSFFTCSNLILSYEGCFYRVPDKGLTGFYGNVRQQTDV